jgi:mono/diheme cytochrome c family protein
MQRHSSGRAVAAIGCFAVLLPFLSVSRADEGGREQETDGWQIPATAKEEKNPMSATPQVLAAGRALFQKNCQRCHGPKGVGDGPDAEPEYMSDMDLTKSARAADNPDGVVFYRIWNGREDPKMPAFKNELSRQQVWTIVTYVQTLRGSPSQ